MKNTMSCQHTLSNDVVFKEVVVIGNGPSGLVTSFMLAGNVPYLKEVPEDLPIDEMLRARLSNIPKGRSLYEVDLSQLAEGLEGRSHNPISILMDNLLRPCADMGIQAESLIDWKYDADKEVDHVVLGRGPPGGAWHTFPPSVRTLSPSAWLALPPHAAAAPGPPDKRLPAAAVAGYCARYVHACNLARYFRSGVVVSGVRRARNPRTPCGPRCPLAASYWVTGFDASSGRAVRYACARAVVACGAGDRPNALPPAPDALHTLGRIERALGALARGDTKEPYRSVLIVGSGVSAADAVMAATSAALRVLHVHRTPHDALRRLHYSDYGQVYKMMCDGATGEYPNYKSYPEHAIVEVTPVVDDSDSDYQAICPKRVKLLNLVTNETVEVTVSIIAVLIGSKPDLFFLQTNFNLNQIDRSPCTRCSEQAKTKIEDDRRQCFLKNHWLYIKSVLGQSIQSCKSRYLNYSEINGHGDNCIVTDCVRRPDKCTCNTNVKTDEKFESIPPRIKCECQPTNPFSNGMGFGIDPSKPVDGRSNPLAIDKGTHELLNTSSGIYALGPITADNFIRFIPGGALALTANIHKQRKYLHQ